MNMKFNFFYHRKKTKLLRRVMPFLNRIQLAYRWTFCRNHASVAFEGERPLVVSLTSYPPRFATLHLTLRSLLLQHLRPTKLILWIAYEDSHHLPEKVTALQKDGLEIRYCEDLKSYKKIIPTLKFFPDAIIVTADDDIYYWPDWLAELVETSRKHPQDVIAHRLHRLQYDGQEIRPYSTWIKNITDQIAHPDNFATGIGGVLYPPECFHSSVLDSEEFKRLCPDADDVWLYWMVRLNGRFERYSGTKNIPYPWRGSQSASLWKKNRHQNDINIERMVSTYGIP
jgi:hypothetical protein